MKSQFNEDLPMNRSQLSTIGAITPLTLLDYPSEMSAIFWNIGCNLRCPYCYNPHFVNSGMFPENCYTLGEIYDFLLQRKDFLDAVVLSGGECSLNDGIFELCEMIHNLGYKIKLDTNGYGVENIIRLLSTDYIQYVALDFKAPEYKMNLFTDDKTYFYQWEQTYRFLLKSSIDFEVRTTYHSKLLSCEDINFMCEFLNINSYKGTYYIQNIFPAAPFLDSSLEPSSKIDLSSIPQTYPFNISIR